MNIKRWWKELRDPSQKCARLGCDVVMRKVVYRIEVSRYGAACEDHTGEQPYCRRCHTEDHPKNTRFLTSYTSVSMPNSYWREMQLNGYCVMEVLK